MADSDQRRQKAQLSLSREFLDHSDPGIFQFEDAYTLGSNINRLQSLVENADSLSEDQEEKVVRLIKSIQFQLSNSGLDSVIESQADHLINRIGDRETPYDPTEYAINEENMNKVQNICMKWDQMLLEELKREKTVPVEDTGIFDANKLLEEPESVFTEPVWIHLDDRPKEDIIESCRNLAIGSSTSSVMLSLRAVEHSLREWYKQKKGEELDRGWGAVLDQLMEEFAEDDKKNATLLNQLSDLPPVLSNLYYLKEKRNEVTHPDESPSSREAQRTLMIVASTITEILQEIQPNGELEEIMIEIEWDVESTEDLVVQILEGLDQELKGAVSREAIYEIGSQADLGHEEVDSAIQNIMMEGKAYEPSEGQIRLI